MGKNRHFICTFSLIVCMLSVFIGCSNMIADYGNSDNGIIRKNDIGATASRTLRNLDFTPGNDNSIFVAKTGSDLTGTGTRTSPSASINNAITLCDASHQRIVILDSGTYVEQGFEFTGNFTGLYAALGEKPVVEFMENPDFWALSEKVPETTYNSALTYSKSVVELQNGNVFIAYESSSSSLGKFKVIESSTGAEIRAEDEFYSGSLSHISAVMMNDGNIFIAYVDYDGGNDRGKYVVLDPDTWTLMEKDLATEFVFHSDTTGHISSTVMSNGNIFIAYEDTGAIRGNYLVLNPDDWTEVHSGSFYPGEIDSVSAQSLENGSIIIFYEDVSNTRMGKYVVLDPDDSWNEVEAGTFRAGRTGSVSSALLSNGDLFIAYVDYDDSNSGNYIILDQNTREIKKTETIFHTDPTSNISPLMLADGSLFIAYSEYSNDYGKYIVLDNSIDHIRVSVDTELNGLILTSRDTAWLDSFISATGSKLTVKWCDIKGNYSSTPNQVCEAVNTNSEISVSNTRFYNNDAGIYAVSNKVEIVDSHFFLNSNGYALYVEGAAAFAGDISVNHTDFFNNSGGIRFVSNSGATEIVKNSIFHSNSLYGINADSAVSLTYSTITGSVLNVTYGTSVVTEDPGYVNSTAGDPDSIDLNIQVTETGYPVDSPARGLADDKRNAGAFDVEYILD